MYELRFDEKTIEFLNKLPEKARARIHSKIVSAKENPFHFFESLKEMGSFKLRVGDFRVIADIDRASKLIEVRLIGHRKNVYKKICNKY